MNILKNVILVLILSISIYCLGQQYNKASYLENLVHQHIQTATIQSNTYLHGAARAVQQNNRLSVATQQLSQIDAHLAAGQKLEVLAKGQALLEADPGNLQVLLRLGIVHLQQQEHALAYEHLLTIYQAPTISSALKTETAWYLALLQAQQKQWKASQQCLQVVLENYTAYRQVAEELLTEVERRL